MILSMSNLKIQFSRLNTASLSAKTLQGLTHASSYPSQKVGITLEVSG